MSSHQRCRHGYSGREADRCPYHTSHGSNSGEPPRKQTRLDDEPVQDNYNYRAFEPPPIADSYARLFYGPGSSQPSADPSSSSGQQPDSSRRSGRFPANAGGLSFLLDESYDSDRSRRSSAAVGASSRSSRQLRDSGSSGRTDRLGPSLAEIEAVIDPGIEPDGPSPPEIQASMGWLTTYVDPRPWGTDAAFAQYIRDRANAAEAKGDRQTAEVLRGAIPAAMVRRVEIRREAGLSSARTTPYFGSSSSRGNASGSSRR